MLNAPSLANRLSHSRQLLLALLLVAFAWLQLAGVVHKYVHTELQTGLQQANLQFEQLLPEHSQQNKSDCQLLDLQCSGFALSQVLPVLVLPLLALQTIRYEAITFFTSPRLVYQARAPPSSSI